MAFDEHSTIIDYLSRVATSERTERRLSLLIYHRDGVEVLPLASSCPVTLGRALPSTLVLADPGLSRKHAAFEVVDGEVWVEDLDSTNGTFVNGEVVRRARIQVGDQVTIGSVSVSLHSRAPVDTELQGLASHDQFHSTVATEIERATTFGRGLALMMVRASDGEAGHLQHWCPRLRTVIRSVDHMALYAPSEIEILLVEADEAYAREIAQAVVALAQAPDYQLFCGVALFPHAASSAEELTAVARRALQATSAARPIVAEVGREAAPPRAAEGPVIRNRTMVEIYQTVSKVADSTIPVLILGETGSGKELVARAIHESSRAARGPLRAINCGAIPEQLIESALFGHERGAFTGAAQQSKGAFEEADRGTLFLDEIGELAPQSQVALLRVLETGRFSRVGSTREISVDVRVVAATHRDLEHMCAADRFRWDLYYRLSTMVLKVPPLRERADEIEPLALQFLAQANAANQRDVRDIAPEVRAILRSYHWPGNVRELRNVIERAVVIARGARLTADDLPERLTTIAATFAAPERPTIRPRARAHTLPTGVPRDVVAAVREQLSRVEASDDASRNASPAAQGLKDAVQALELEMMRSALRHTDGNQSQAAALLGMPRRTLVHKIRAYAIGKEDLQDAPAWSEQPALELKERIEQLEAQLIGEALRRSGGNQAEAARALSIAERTLAAKARKYQLK